MGTEHRKSATCRSPEHSTIWLTPNASSSSTPSRRPAPAEAQSAAKAAETGGDSLPPLLQPGMVDARPRRNRASALLPGFLVGTNDLPRHPRPRWPGRDDVRLDPGPTIQNRIAIARRRPRILGFATTTPTAWVWAPASRTSVSSRYQTRPRSPSLVLSS